MRRSWLWGEAFGAGMMLAVMLAIPVSAAAQSTTWAITYGGSGQDKARSLQQTSDSGFIVAGFTDSFGVGAADFWVLKLKADGWISWQKTYGTSDVDQASSVVQTDDDQDGQADDGYVVAGISAGQLWVLKLDSNGDVSWQKLYDGTVVDEPSIQQTSDGGYVVATSTASYYTSGGGPHGLVLKLDGKGDIVWQKTYGISGWLSSARLRAVRQTKDGGYIVAGSSTTSGVQDLWVLKLDSLGSPVWQNIYSAANSATIADCVLQTSDGGYIVAGAANAGSSAIWWQFLLVRLNSDGSLVWQKTYSEGEAFSVGQASDGGFYVTGRTNPFDPNTSSFKTSDSAFGLFKIAADGSIAWQRVFDRSLSDNAYAVVQTSDGGYAVAGETNESSLGSGEYDYAVVKLDQQGGIEDCDLVKEGKAEAADLTVSVVGTTVESMLSSPPQPTETVAVPSPAPGQVQTLCTGARITHKFTPADLEGRWYVHILSSGDSPQWVGYGYGHFDIDGAGNYVGSVVYSDGSSDNPYGTISITTDGILGEKFIPNAHGVMSDDKNIMVFASGGGPPGRNNLLVFTKLGQSVSYASSDLEGRWYTHFLSSGDAPQWIGYGYGFVDVQSSGDYTGEVNYSDGSSGNPSGALIMNADGTIVDKSHSDIHGVMSSDKNVMVFTGVSGPPGDYNLFVFTKQSKSAMFTTADLEGTWYPHFLSSGDSPQWVGYGYGIFKIDRSGVYSGKVNYSDGSSGSPQGTLSINAEGIITDKSSSDIHGAMSSDKNIMVFTGFTGPPGDCNLFFFMKGKHVNCDPAPIWLLLSDPSPE